MVSEFTRNICANLCIQNAIGLEISRLRDKEAILRKRGALTCGKTGGEPVDNAGSDCLVYWAFSLGSPQTHSILCN
jgi:hypothetical protein